MGLFNEAAYVFCKPCTLGSAQRVAGRIFRGRDGYYEASEVRALPDPEGHGVMEVNGKEWPSRNIALKYYIGYICHICRYGARVLACELGRLVRRVYDQGTEFYAKIITFLKGKML